MESDRISDDAMSMRPSAPNRKAILGRSATGGLNPPIFMLRWSTQHVVLQFGLTHLSQPTD